MRFLSAALRYVATVVGIMSVFYWLGGLPSGGMLVGIALALYLGSVLLKPADSAGKPSGQNPAAHSTVPVRFVVESRTEVVENDEDDGYSQFVEAMWRRKGTSLLGITLSKVGGVSIPFKAHSLVQGENGSLYLNGWEGSRRKTYAADDRHKWAYRGQQVDTSAFLAIGLGQAPESALTPQRRPASIEEATGPEFDRVVTSDRRYVVRYVNSAGLPSFRVISRVVRGRDGFTARCHFRWGQRRNFHFEGLREVVDAETGEVIPVDAFVTGDVRKRSRRG